MDLPPELQVDVDIKVQEVLLAASNLDVDALQALVKEDPNLVDAQDPETGFTAAHALVAACDYGGNDGGGGGRRPNREDERKAEVALRCLFDRGAAWNLLDAAGETPGCMAIRLGLLGLFYACVNEGVAAQRRERVRSEYVPLRDGSEDRAPEDDDWEMVDAESVATGEGIGPSSPPSVGEVREGLFGRAKVSVHPGPLRRDDLDAYRIEVETAMADMTVREIRPPEEPRILSVGHGAGFLSAAIQRINPREHHIIESNPSVLEQMKSEGWNERPGVTLHGGSWQAILPYLADDGYLFDHVLFDAFTEDYDSFVKFFSESLHRIQHERGCWSYIERLGDRRVTQEMFAQIVYDDTSKAGWNCEPNLSGSLPQIDDYESSKTINSPKAYDKYYSVPICEFMRR